MVGRLYLCLRPIVWSPHTAAVRLLLWARWAGDQLTVLLMPGARRRGRPCTAWMDSIKTWTGLPVEESVRMTEDRDKWRKYVHGVVNPRIEDS